MRGRIPNSAYNLFVTLILIIVFHLLSAFSPQPDAKKKLIKLEHAESYTHDDKISKFADRLIGSVALSHNNVLLYCDSAYLYKDSNKVDGFNHVHIVQGDTLNLYGNRIKYDGNTKIATIIGNVKLVNKSITLTTDEMVFDLRTNIGNYHNWGKIVDTANVLVSKIGRYYANEDMCLFKDSVKVTNKDFILKADTLKYHTKSERVILVGPTHIVGTTKQGVLYSEKGWYDTRKNVAELYKASRIMGKEQTLQGDTIYYSKKEGTGRARSRVLLSDTTNHIAISGRIGVYNERTKVAFVTDSALFMQFSKKDTLFLHADTLKSIPDLTPKEAPRKPARPSLAAKKSVTTKADSAKSVSTDTLKLPQLAVETPKLPTDSGKIAVSPKLTHRENPLYRDSVQTIADTVKTKEQNDNKLFMAYHHVRFFKKDLMGLCDSLSYQSKDSVMRLFKDPVLWSDVHQMTAEKIEYRPHKPGPDIARLDNNGFIISREDSIKYNQISGKTMIGYIVRNELDSIAVSGNAVTLYYIKNKDAYSGLNKLESSRIVVFLVKGKIDLIDFLSAPTGKSIPMKDLTSEESTLRGFEWRESEKPKNRFDLWPLDEKRKKIAGPGKKPASNKK